MKEEFMRFQWILLAVLAFCFGSCKDDDATDQAAMPYDPSKPVEITGFTPESGGGNTFIVLYGKNFGTDKSIMKLTCGGKDAVIINTLGNSIYAIVPEKAFKGNFVLTIGKGEQAQTIEAEKKFDYTRQMVVSTLCGKEKEDGSWDVINGPFDDCGGFERASWFSFDPENKDILYLAQDNEGGSLPIRVLDLKNKQVYTNNNVNLHRPRTITWPLGRNPQGIMRDTMIIACDKGGDRDVNNYYVVRDKTKPAHEQFNGQPQSLMEGKNCNGSAIHPINGELYYNCYSLGTFYRYDYLSAWNEEEGKFDFTKAEQLFSIQDVNWEFNMVIHPSGRYAYIVVINQHYIMRTDYIPSKKKFGVPYLFCGSVGQAAWADGTGDKARLNQPYQGVFVKNKQYEAEGKDDIYDFYFTDKHNHCIRKLTPEGSVTTFAGRGSSALNNDPWGYVDGELREKARFDRPQALAYDEETETFYVGDTENHCIRKIAIEEGDEETADTDSPKE